MFRPNSTTAREAINVDDTTFNHVTAVRDGHNEEVTNEHIEKVSIITTICP